MNEDNLQTFQSFGIFKDPQHESSEPTPITLNELLMSPFFWKSGKISSFFKDSWNYINFTDQDGTSDEIKRLQETLKAKSKHALSSNNPDWTKAFSETEWDVIRKVGSKSKHPPPGTVRLKEKDGNFQQIYDLLRTIRNKMEHVHELGDEELAALGWLLNDHFIENKCIAFWLDKFPKLLPFLWSKYLPFRSCPTFKPYYPSALDNDHLFCFNWEKETLLPDVITQFNKGLDIHLEEGRLENRYICTGNSTKDATKFVLEFRILDSVIIRTLLDSNSFAEIKLSNDTLSFGWCAEENGDTTNLIHYTTKPKVSSSQTAEMDNVTTYAVVANCIKEGYIVGKRTCEKVIFFIDKNFTSKVQSAAKRFAKVNKVNLEEDPLNWHDLQTKKKILEIAGKVTLQNKVVKLTSILPDNVDDRESVLSELKGRTLNELLRKGKPVIFDKYKMPKLVEPYQQRRLCSFKEISSKVLRHRSSDKIIVTNIGLEEMQKLVNPSELENIFQLETIKDILNAEDLLTHRLFWLKETGQHYNNILKNFKSRLTKSHHGTNIHCLQFLKNNTFQWQWTYGSLSIIKKSFVKKSADMVVMDEEDFLGNIESCEREPIFIADTPGMGKTVVLNSLAYKMSEMFERTFVILLNMSDFIAKLDKRPIGNKTLEQVQTVIQNTVSNTEFEKSLINSWLKQTGPNSKINIELMLDGLDEVEHKHKKLTIDVLKIIQRELPSVRLWVTLRQHMQDEIEKQFSMLSFKIEPFSESDQIDYLKNYWSKSRDESDETLERFAVNCIRRFNAEIDTTQIAGAPLQCRLLGEMYENYDDSFPVESISLTKLYEQMIEKKLKVYFKDKMGAEKLPDEIVKPVHEKMEQCHILLANKLILSDWEGNAFCKTLGTRSPDKDILVSLVGIVDNLEPVRFIHRTFAEYYVAQFICIILSDEDATLKLDKDDVEPFQKLFLSQVLEVTKHQHLANSVVSKFKTPVLCYFLNAMLKNNAQIPPNLTSLLTKIHDFNPDVTVFDSSKSIIFATLHHNYFNLAQLLLESLNMEARHTFLEKTKDKHSLFLEISIRFASVEFFKYICSLIETWHEENQSSYTVSRDLFKLALTKGKYDIVKFLVESNKGFGQETWSSFQSNDTKKLGIIHHIIGKSRHDKECDLTEKEKLLKYVVQVDRSTLEQRDKDGLTPILTRFSTSFKLKSFLITELGANVNAKGNYGNTAFHWKSFSDYRGGIRPDQYHEMLEVFLANGFTEINSVSNIGLTPLQCAIKTYYDLLEEKTLELFNQVGADFNAKDSDGSTILHVCILRKCEIKFIEKLIQCGSDISEKNSKGQCAFQLAVETDNLLLAEILKEKSDAEDIGICDNRREE